MIFLTPTGASFKGHPIWSTVIAGILTAVVSEIAGLVELSHLRFWLYCNLWRGADPLSCGE